jgi:hypothetical protein
MKLTPELIDYLIEQNNESIRQSYHTICKELEALHAKGRARGGKLNGEDVLQYQSLINRKYRYDNNPDFNPLVSGIDKDYDFSK